MAEQAKSIAALQADYDALAKRASGFDKETAVALRKFDDERKKYLEQRKAERVKLLAQKLAAFKALDAAKAAAKPAK